MAEKRVNLSFDTNNEQHMLVYEYLVRMKRNKTAAVVNSSLYLEAIKAKRTPNEELQIAYFQEAPSAGVSSEDIERIEKKLDAVLLMEDSMSMLTKNVTGISELLKSGASAPVKENPLNPDNRDREDYDNRDGNEIDDDAFNQMASMLGVLGNKSEDYQ